MERLTWECELDGFTDIGLRDGVTVDTAICRLAAYENIGLEPEQVAFAKKIIEDTFSDKPDFTERLRELAQADREGRCVVLPCKRDDVLWTFQTYPSERVYSFHVTDLSTLNGRTMLNTDIMGVVDARDVGKAAFLTRAEAEAALKERKVET